MSSTQRADSLTRSFKNVTALLAQLVQSVASSKVERRAPSTSISSSKPRASVQVPQPPISSP